MRIKEVYVRWTGIPILAGLIVFMLDTPADSLIKQYFHSLIFTAVFWNGGFLIFLHFRKRFPEISQTPKRILFTVTVLISFLVFFDFLVCYFIHRDPIQELFESGRLFRYMPINFTMSLILGSVYENVYFFDNWKKTFRAHEQLKNQQIRTQFEVLQNQMSPHFLFNSLNTLTTLISENQNTAIDFTQKLSDVYRYILQQKERELVPLAEELAFATDYVFLLKMRYPDNLIVSFDVAPQLKSLLIAPLTLQMLIENAIKHNVVSKAHPLEIEVYTQEETIFVKNKLKRKTIIEKSTKTGLHNIRKRYELLGKTNIKVEESSDEFVVAVPLIALFSHRIIEVK